MPLPPEQLQLALASSPDLQAAGTDQVAQIVDALSSALEAPPSMVLQLVWKRPALLQASPQDVLVAFEQLAAAMSLPTTGGDGASSSSSSGGRAQAVRAACRLPALLDVAPESAFASRAATIMGVGRGETAAMLCRAPDAGCLAAVLSMPSNTMRQQLIDVQAVMDSRWGPSARMPVTSYRARNTIVQL